MIQVWKLQNGEVISSGDRVRYLNHRNRPEGHIIDIDHFNDIVTIKWEDPNLIPRTQSFPKDAFYDGSLEVLNKTSSDWGKPKCECGAKFDRHDPNGHSTWCKLYRSKK